MKKINNNQHFETIGRLICDEDFEGNLLSIIRSKFIESQLVCYIKIIIDRILSEETPISTEDREAFASFVKFISQENFTLSDVQENDIVELISSSMTEREGATRYFCELITVLIRNVSKPAIKAEIFFDTSTGALTVKSVPCKTIKLGKIFFSPMRVEYLMDRDDHLFWQYLVGKISPDELESFLLEHLRMAIADKMFELTNNIEKNQIWMVTGGDITLDLVSNDTIEEFFLSEPGNKLLQICKHLTPEEIARVNSVISKALQLNN